MQCHKEKPILNLDPRQLIELLSKMGRVSFMVCFHHSKNPRIEKSESGRIMWSRFIQGWYLVADSFKIKTDYRPNKVVDTIQCLHHQIIKKNNNLRQTWQRFEKSDFGRDCVQ